MDVVALPLAGELGSFWMAVSPFVVAGRFRGYTPRWSSCQARRGRGLSGATSCYLASVAVIPRVSGMTRQPCFGFGVNQVPRADKVSAPQPSGDPEAGVWQETR